MINVALTKCKDLASEQDRRAYDVDWSRCRGRDVRDLESALVKRHPVSPRRLELMTMSQPTFGERGRRRRPWRCSALFADPSRSTRSAPTTAALACGRRFEAIQAVRIETRSPDYDAIRPAAAEERVQ